MSLEFTKRLEEVANGHNEEFIKICAEREIFNAFYELKMTLKKYGKNSSNLGSIKAQLRHLFNIVGIKCCATDDFQSFANKVKDFEKEYLSYGTKTIDQEFGCRALLSIYGLCREHFTPEDYMFRIVNSLENEDHSWRNDSLRIRILKKFIKNGNFMEYKYENPAVKSGVSTKKLVGGKNYIIKYVKNKIGKNPQIPEDILSNIDDEIYKPYEKDLQEVNVKFKNIWNKEVHEKLEPFLKYLVKDFADQYFAGYEKNELKERGNFNKCYVNDIDEHGSEKDKTNKYITVHNLRDKVLSIDNSEISKFDIYGSNEEFINMRKSLVDAYNSQIRNSYILQNVYERHGDVKWYHTLYELTEACLLLRKVVYEAICSIVKRELKKYDDNSKNIEDYLGEILDRYDELKKEYEAICSKGSCYDTKIVVFKIYLDKYIKERYEKQLMSKDANEKALASKYYAIKENIQKYIDSLKIRNTIALISNEDLGSYYEGDKDYDKVMSILDCLADNYLGNNYCLDIFKTGLVSQYNSKVETSKFKLLNWFGRINSFDELCRIAKIAEEQNRIFNQAMYIVLRDRQGAFIAANGLQEKVPNKKFVEDTDNLLDWLAGNDNDSSIYAYIREELLRKVNLDLREKGEEPIKDFIELYNMVISYEHTSFNDSFYDYFYSITSRELNKCNKYVKNFDKFAESLTDLTGNGIKAHIIETFHNETDGSFKGTIKLLNEYINQKYVELNALEKDRNAFLKEQACYYKEKAKIEKYIYAFKNMKLIPHIKKIIYEIKKCEQNLKSQEKAANSLSGKYGLLKLADDLAYGKFRSNGYTRQALYWTAMVYGMKYKQYLDAKYGMDSSQIGKINLIEDFEKSLFRDYYVDNWLRIITDSYRNNVNAFDSHLTDQGINYKNFVEFVMIYYIVKDNYTPEQKIKLSDQMINRILARYKEIEKVKSNFIEKSTIYFKNLFIADILDMSEKDFEDFIVEESGFQLSVDSSNKSVFQIANTQKSATKEYEELLNDIISAYSLKNDCDEDSIKQDSQFFRTECSYGLQFGELAVMAKDEKGVIARKNFIDRMEDYERKHNTFNIHSPLTRLDVSTRAERFFYLIEKVHQYLKNILNEPIEELKYMSRSRLLSAQYYLYNMTTGDESLDGIFEEFQFIVDKSLETYNYTKLSSKNIFDRLLVLSAYMRCKDERMI